MNAKPTPASTTGADSACVESHRPQDACLEALNLECVRHDRTLFSALNFRVSPGQIVQIEGANGSGKTSLLRMLCGMLLPAEGEVRWCGEDIYANRSAFLAEVAYVGHAPGIKAELTPLENLRMAQALGSQRAGSSLEQALEDVGLYGFEDVPCRTLSAGQRRRVALAGLLVAHSSLWILDEPFTALDKTGRGLIEGMLETHSKNGGMAVLTTHQAINLSHCPMSSVHLTS